MKKITLLFALTIVMSLINPVLAGDGKKDRPDRFGIRAGYQSSGWVKDGSRYMGSQDYNSFYLGLFKENKIIPLLHLGAGLEYMQCGAKMKSGNNYVLSYLGVPVYFKAKVGPVYGLAGLGINFKVAEKHEDIDAFPPDQEIKTMDVPGFLGVGFRFLMISVEGRYYWGLMDINNGIKNQYWQLGAAVSF